MFAASGRFLFVSLFSATPSRAGLIVVLPWAKNFCPTAPRGWHHFYSSRKIKACPIASPDNHEYFIRIISRRAPPPHVHTYARTRVPAPVLQLRVLSSVAQASVLLSMVLVARYRSPTRTCPRLRSHVWNANGRGTRMGRTDSRRLARRQPASRSLETRQWISMGARVAFEQPGAWNGTGNRLFFHLAIRFPRL